MIWFIGDRSSIPFVISIVSIYCIYLTILFANPLIAQIVAMCFTKLITEETPNHQIVPGLLRHATIVLSMRIGIIYLVGSPLGVGHN
jgi:hypothetical protein